MSEAAWDKAFTHGSKSMQDRLRKVHAKNPKFQSWLKTSGHGSGQSVKQASKEIKPSARIKTLQQKSLKAYGATKGTRMGSEDGSGEKIRDTIAPLTRDQHSKVQAAQRAAKAAVKPATPKKPLTKDQRLAAIAAAARKAKAKHDVPTMEPDDEGHDDLRDVHQSLHIRRGYNEEMKKVNEIVGVLAAMDKADKARSSNLKVGDNVRSIKMPIPGKVEKIKDGKVYFRHESGKLYATHAGNLRKEELQLMDEATKRALNITTKDLDIIKSGDHETVKNHMVKLITRAADTKTNSRPLRADKAKEFLDNVHSSTNVGQLQKMAYNMYLGGDDVGKSKYGNLHVYKPVSKMGRSYQRRYGIGEEKVEEGYFKNIDTERKETARLAAQEKEPPFTPDKKKVRRGPGGPMSQAKWLAKQAMMKKMKEMGMKEEVEQTDEAVRVKDISVSNTLGSLKKAKPGANFIAKDRAEISRKIAAHDVKSVRKKTVGNPAMRSAALKRAGYEVRKEEIESIEEGLFDKKTPEEKASKFRRAVERSVYTKSMKDNLTKDIGKGPGLKSRLGGVKSAASKYLSTTNIGKKIDKYRTNRSIAAYNRSKGVNEDVELEVRKEAVSFGRSGGVMHYDPKTEKSEKPAKGVSALDKDGNLVGHYRDLETAKKMKPGHTYQTSKGVAKEEVEQTDEALLPKQQKVADKLKASELAANKEKAGYKFGKSLRDMKVAAKMKKEEVEQINELSPATYTSAAQKARGQGTAYAAKATTQAGAAMYGSQQGKHEPNSPAAKMHAFAQKRFNQAGKFEKKAGLKPGGAGIHSYDPTPGDKGYSKGGPKPLTREEVEYIEEKLTAADPASEWIKDFVASDNPKFEGKSKKERIQMALGAYYAAKRSKNEQVVNEVADEPKHGDAGEYDYEGDMAKSQLRSIMTNAKRMHDMLEDNTNLPEWVQSKITLAEDYVLTATNYMESEMNEEVEQVTEAEGSVPKTPKEKELAKHYGDPNRITHGDVVTARKKSAAISETKMKEKIYMKVFRGKTMTKKPADPVVFHSMNTNGKQKPNNTK
jgi:hypothetical protein